MSAEEPPVTHLEGSEGVASPRSSESARSREIDLPSSTEVGAHLPQLGTWRPFGSRGEGQRLEFDKRNSSKMSLLGRVGRVGWRQRQASVCSTVRVGWMKPGEGGGREKGETDGCERCKGKCERNKV